MLVFLLFVVFPYIYIGGYFLNSLDEAMKEDKTIRPRWASQILEALLVVVSLFWLPIVIVWSMVKRNKVKR